MAEASGQEQDNFLLLRLMAASLVIYGHGNAISANAAFPDVFVWLGWGSYSGAIAVSAFFVISGFMITGSYLRRRHLPSFLWARFLRIYPAYAFCLVVTAYLVGAMVTTWPLADYLRDHQVTRYVSKNLELGKYLAYHLPGVFNEGQVGGAVNGSIWTLPAEARMYLWVAIAGVTGILGRKYLASVLIAALIAWGVMRPASIPLVPLAEFVSLAGYFALGAFCFVNREWVYVGWPVAMAAGVLAWLAHGSAVHPFAMAVALTSFVFAFAYDTRWYGFNRCGDYSYGLYLWGFPIQQVVAHQWPGTSGLANAAIAWPLAMATGIVSWHVVEKPALGLKALPGNAYKRLASVKARASCKVAPWLPEDNS
ncbi:acyltransferase family protein [Dyella telluris]|uniref:Acyltransferase n=1 Tax=Dyella telluris TaxID=2763498 RepID=A0A7G8PZA3_9GAMM|nr:acyltransferase [Dyella telluris]QNJ99860.1 acyltransferase [Dyella telluris]